MTRRRRALTTYAAVGLISTACIPVQELPVVTGPAPLTDLGVTATTGLATVFEQSRATLSAVATGGAPPYAFRWNLNAGPTELALDDVTSRAYQTDSLTETGRYVFRVVATDSVGTTATGFVAVEVVAAVTASAPPLAVVGQPVELTATLATNDITVNWLVTGGAATFDDSTSTTPMITTSAGETVDILLAATLTGTEGTTTTVTRSLAIVSVSSLSPRVLIETNLGDITIELDGEAAPLHTANFLLYLDEGFFDGLLFHRNACTPTGDECEPFILQGGGIERVDGELVEKEPTRDPVASEADNGLTNAEINTVAMALAGGDPNSGTTQFFINLADNGFLDDSGFTAFARVVGGFDTLDTITSVETGENPFAPPGELSLPLEDVIMESVSRVAP